MDLKMALFWKLVGLGGLADTVQWSRKDFTIPEDMGVAPVSIQSMIKAYLAETCACVVIHHVKQMEALR